MNIKIEDNGSITNDKGQKLYCITLIDYNNSEGDIHMFGFYDDLPTKEEVLEQAKNEYVDCLNWVEQDDYYSESVYIG